MFRTGFNDKVRGFGSTRMPELVRTTEKLASRQGEAV